MFFLLLHGNHDLCVTNTLPSVHHDSLTKAMVGLHCICTWYSTLAFCICDFITDRSIASYQEFSNRSQLKTCWLVMKETI